MVSSLRPVVPAPVRTEVQLQEPEENVICCLHLPLASLMSHGLCPSSCTSCQLSSDIPSPPASSSSPNCQPTHHRGLSSPLKIKKNLVCIILHKVPMRKVVVFYLMYLSSQYLLHNSGGSSPLILLPNAVASWRDLAGCALLKW